MEGVRLGRIFCIVLFGLLISSFVFANSFETDKVFLKLTMNEGEVALRGLKVVAVKAGDFDVQVRGIDFASVENGSFSLEEGEERSFDVGFDAVGKEPGVYVGRVIISEGNREKVVPVIVEVETDEVLFDGIIEVPLEYTKVFPGETAIFENKIFNLENLGVSNVRVSFSVDDFFGNNLFLEHENIVVDTQFVNTKSILLSQDILPGDYLFSIKMEFGDSIGTSTYFFRILEKEAERPDYNLVVMGIVVVLLIALVFFIIYYISRRDKVILGLQRQYRREIRGHRKKCK